MITICQKQAEELVEFIQPTKLLPPEISESICNVNRQKLIKQLLGLSVYASKLSELKQELKRYYYTSQISAGESVGIIAAQAIGEFQTQSTLNTFHSSGALEKTVCVGVPKTNELLNASKSQKVINCRIYLNKRLSCLSDIRNIINNKLVCIRGSDIGEFSIIDDVVMKEKNVWWHKPYELLYGDIDRENKRCIRLKLNIQVMYKYRITSELIVSKIEESYKDIKCIYSPLKLGIIHIFVDMLDIEFPDEYLVFVNRDNYQDIYLDECVIPILSKLIICGIDGISNIFYFKPINDNDEWYIETEGCNFKKLMGCDFIDTTRIRSNYIWDIYNNLGIEACREFLIEEFKEVMEGINMCHVKLLVDKMTFYGIISSITRYTLRKDECGPLIKASFEESLDIFIKASFNCDKESTKGISASIICGKRGNIGTGFNDVRLDLGKLISPVIEDI